MGVDFMLSLTPPWKHVSCQAPKHYMLWWLRLDNLFMRCGSRQTAVALDDSCSACVPRRYLYAVTERSAVEDILHRVNNLLGTIEIQSEVARSIGTVESMTQALDLIVASARRTRDELQVLRGERPE